MGEPEPIWGLTETKPQKCKRIKHPDGDRSPGDILVNLEGGTSWTPGSLRLNFIGKDLWSNCGKIFHVQCLHIGYHLILR